MALGRANGFRVADVQCIARLGIVARLEGDYARARALIEEGLALAEAFGHRPAACSYLTSLGNLARCEGNYPEARRLLMASLELGQRDVWLPLVLQNAIGSLGVLAIAQNLFRPGICLLAAIAAGGRGARHKCLSCGTTSKPRSRRLVRPCVIRSTRKLGRRARRGRWTKPSRRPGRRRTNLSLPTGRLATLSPRAYRTLSPGANARSWHWSRRAEPTGRLVRCW